MTKIRNHYTEAFNEFLNDDTKKTFVHGTAITIKNDTTENMTVFDKGDYLMKNGSYNMIGLLANVAQWSKERGLDTAEPAKQLVKMQEELDETIAAYNDGDREGVIDGIGDMLVVLKNFALQQDLTLEECLAHAWNEIKDRKGKMVNGIFVKEADLKDEE